MGNRVWIASDHNGNAARAYVCKVLMREGHDVYDLSTRDGESKVDYPEVVERLWWEMFTCNAIDAERGILICGTGTGMCIAANKRPGIRAGLATDRATAELLREHNDCNVLCLGQWRNSLSQMDEMVRAFMDTSFTAGRHVKRVDMLRGLDKKIRP